MEATVLITIEMFLATRGFFLFEIRCISPGYSSFLTGIFSHMTRLHQSRASENI